MIKASALIGKLAKQHGLATAPLFRATDAPKTGKHAILLDGAVGSFAVSIAEEIDPFEASSWAWSSNIPHHVSVANDKVHVLRWDRPDDPTEYQVERVLERPTEFYEYLRGDRTQETRTIVTHSMELFRSVRNLVHHAGLPDGRSIAAYLALLGPLVAGKVPSRQALAALKGSFELPHDAADILSLLPQGAVERLLQDYQSLSLGNRALTTSPSLAVRHASGAIFQEAHHLLVQGESPDLFNYVSPTPARKAVRGGVHFTPPFLARALSEQVFGAMGDLHTRKRIVVADIACGSGAFLVEALRALERLDFKGHVTLVGRDTSSPAIEMARFVLHASGREWPGPNRIKIDLANQDTLIDDLQPKADAIVMNPPFTRWQDLTHDQREIVVGILDKHATGRPDIGMAFVSRAVKFLKPGGALATLIPAAALDSRSFSGWRNELAERKHVHLTALFDNQSLFSHAKVRVGAIVLCSTASRERIDIHASNDPESAGDALRALRRGLPTAAVEGKFSLRSVKPLAKLDTGAIKAARSVISWGAVAALSRVLTQRAQKSVTTTIAELFSVKQGIRTGENAAFVLDKKHFLELPKAERTFFRRAISSRGIQDGQITSYVYVFYPYGKHHTIATEDELRQRLPEFCTRYLQPHRETLSSRRDRADRWWELSERRPGLEQSPPVLVSKYWAKPGGFVVPENSRALVLQGFGWVPHRLDLSTLPKQSDIVLAYLALLNSRSFFGLLAEHAPPTGGGQLDMSPRYLDNVPLVDLVSRQSHFSTEIRKLAQYARWKYLSETTERRVQPQVAEALCSRLLGISASEPEARPSKKYPAPLWFKPLIQSNLKGTDRRQRVEVLIKMQDLARSGGYSEIDGALEHAPVAALAETSLMTLLRGTYRFRSQLKDWQGFRDRVADELRQRNAPVDRLLIGLYE